MATTISITSFYPGRERPSRIFLPLSFRRPDWRSGSLFRKILEKQNWDKVYGNAMLREYGRVRPLSGEEQEIFRVRLSYPEKFWKLADHDYGSRKLDS